jgi:branched-chain amino acid transport system permease protein
MFLQQCMNGLSLGSVYALIALGYSMVYGILRFINFAHGEIVMVGAYVSFFVANYCHSLGWGTLPTAFCALTSSMVFCAFLGMAIEKIAYKPLRESPKINLLITAIGVSLFLQFGGQWLLGADPKVFPPLIPNIPLYASDQLVITLAPLIVILIALALAGLLHLFIHKTKLGTAMRAVANHPDAASLVGIPNNRIISLTFAMGSALAGAAGSLFATLYPSITPLMGIFPGLKAFVAAVLGGIGSLGGAVAGGLLMGLIETMTSAYISPIFRDAIAFSMLILILLIKPSGLFQRKKKDKV